MGHQNKFIGFVGWTVLLAFLYFLTGKIGLFLAIPPGYATLIWPPSGIALGMLILFGTRLWPGILLGSLVLNTSVSGVFSTPEGLTLANCALSLAIALGSTLQAVLAKVLLEKFLDFPFEISNPKNTFKLFLIALPLACVVATTVGSLSLYVGGKIPFENVPATWLNWWLGDMFGVLIFLPVVLLLPGANSKLVWHGKKLGTLPGIAFLILLVSLGFTFYGWKIASENFYKRSLADFKNLTLENEKSLLAHLDSYRHALLGGDGFYQGSSFVSREEWHEYVKNIDIKNNFPGMMGMGLIFAVPPQDLDEFVKRTRADGLPDFTIHPETTDTPYYIIKYIEPESENKKAVGLNIAFEKNRLDAATLSAESGLDALTNRIILVQDSEKTPGFLLLHPLYKKNAPLTTVQEKRNALLGWVYAPFVAKQLLQNLTTSQGDTIHLEIYDGTTASPETLIYSSRQSDFDKAPKSVFSETKIIDVLQQKWLVVWSSTPTFEREESFIGPKLLLIGGLLFTTMLAAFLASTLLQNSEEKVEGGKSWSPALPWIVFLILTASSFYLYHTIKDKDLDYAKASTEAEAKKIKKLITLTATQKILALQRMAKRWEIAKGTPFNQWQADASQYIKRIGGLKAVEWIDPTYHIQWVEPSLGNEKAIGLNIAFDEKRKLALQGAQNSDTITLTPPLDLVQGFKGFISYSPLYYDGQFHGFIAGVFSIDDFLNSVIGNETFDNFSVRLKNQNDVFFENEFSDQSLKDWNYESDISLFNQNWRIQITPTEKFVQNKLSNLPLISLASGIAISILFSLTAHYIIVANLKSKSLRISEERHRLLIDGAKDYAIYMLDPNGNVASWNSGAELLKGYTADEIIGKHFSIFYTKEDRQKGLPAKVLATALATGKFEDQNCVRVRKDGSQLRLHVVLDPIYTDNGKLLGFVKITRNVTEKIEQAAKITEVSRRLELATKSAQIGVWDWNILSNELIWDDTMITLYGLDQSSFLGAYETWEKSVHPEDIDAVREKLQKAALGKEKFDTTFRVVWPDHSIHYIRAMADAVCDESGKTIKMVGVNWDVTRQNEVDRMKNEFVSTVSHELRTPLTSIRGSLGLISGGVAGELSEKAKPLIQIALSNCERLIRLINDILDIEKIESGKMDFHVKPTELSSLIKTTVLANESFAKSYNVNLINLTQTNTKLWANVDPDKIMQVVTNLISNAVKFSPKPGTVEVSIQKNDNQIRIAIQDHGSGIPDEFKTKIFEKFAQADSSDTRQNGGTGLGLSISKAIVELHGGKIGFTSSKENGTCFYFDLLPLQTPPKIANLTENANQTRQKRFLVCEHDADIAALLGLTLKEEGYSVDTASNASEAKTLIAKNHYDGMTLDIMLPDQDAIDFLEELRLQENSKELPVIIVSIKEFSESRKIQLIPDLQISAWIPKPIDADKILQGLTHLQKKDENRLPSVLHVEDDDDIFSVVREILQKTANVDGAKSCFEAKENLAQKNYDLILLDLKLPDDYGLTLLPYLQRKAQKSKIVIFSALDVSIAQNQNVAAVLIKSETSNEKLKLTIQGLLDSKQKRGA